MIRAAALSKTSRPLNAISDQLNVWYDRDSSGTFLGNFHSERVPAGWDDNNGPTANLYRSVVRPSCRGCHVALISPIPGIQFNSEPDFTRFASTIASDLVAYRMPQALQTIREFWQSPQPGFSRITSELLVTVLPLTRSTRARPGTSRLGSAPDFDNKLLNHAHRARRAKVT